MNEQGRGRIREIVEQRMASFEAAERALDASALIGHFSTAGDFYMHNDGQRLTWAAVADVVKQAFLTLRSLEGGFNGLEVLVLAADAALATATFHETITTQDGTVVRQRGAASWLWRCYDGEWQIAYVTWTTVPTRRRRTSPNMHIWTPPVK